MLSLPIQITITPNTVQTHYAHTTSVEVEETHYSAPSGLFLFFFFLIIFLTLRAVFSSRSTAAYGDVLLGALQSRIFIFTHYTHTHTLGRRTIIYRTTSSVRRIRHPCASLQQCRIENIITTRSPLIIIVAVVVVRFSRIFSHFN